MILCSICDRQKAQDGYATCPGCRERQAKNMATYRKRKSELGICRYGGCGKPKAGKFGHCEGHAKVNNIRTKHGLNMAQAKVFGKLGGKCASCGADNRLVVFEKKRCGPRRCQKLLRLPLDDLKKKCEVGCEVCAPVIPS